MKKIGTAIYTHATRTPFLPLPEKELFQQAVFHESLPAGVWEEYTVVKVDLKNKKVTFIMSSDFDTAREPEVGDAYTIDLEKGTCKITRSKGQIYHHKWMFVTEKYEGFDVAESKSWSELWRAVFPQDRKISSRIGYRKYWNEYLEQFGLEIKQ
ncbi:MAG: hypothetical protein ACRCX2_20060 [Paraclostridium sp.]